MGMTLLIKQTVDVLNIVEGVIDEELEFWDDAKLMAFKVAKSEANLTCLSIDVLEYLLCLVGWEDTEVCLCNREVWADTNYRHRDKDTACLACLLLEDCAEVFLNETSNLILSCCFQLFLKFMSL